MNEQEFYDALDRYLEGLLAGRELEDFLQAVESTGKYQAELEAHRALVRMMEELPREKAPPALRAKIIDQLRADAALQPVAPPTPSKSPSIWSRMGRLFTAWQFQTAVACTLGLVTFWALAQRDMISRFQQMQGERSQQVVLSKPDSVPTKSPIQNEGNSPIRNSSGSLATPAAVHPQAQLAVHPKAEPSADLKAESVKTPQPATKASVSKQPEPQQTRLGTLPAPTAIASPVTSLSEKEVDYPAAEETKAARTSGIGGITAAPSAPETANTPGAGEVATAPSEAPAPGLAQPSVAEPAIEAAPTSFPGIGEASRPDASDRIGDERVPAQKGTPNALPQTGRTMPLQGSREGRPGSMAGGMPGFMPGSMPGMPGAEAPVSAGGVQIGTESKKDLGDVAAPAMKDNSQAKSQAGRQDPYYKDNELPSNSAPLDQERIARGQISGDRAREKPSGESPRAIAGDAKMIPAPEFSAAGPGQSHGAGKNGGRDKSSRDRLPLMSRTQISQERQMMDRMVADSRAGKQKRTVSNPIQEMAQAKQGRRSNEPAQLSPHEAYNAFTEGVPQASIPQKHAARVTAVVNVLINAGAPQAISFGDIETKLKAEGVDTRQMRMRSENGAVYDGLRGTIKGKDMKWLLAELASMGIQYNASLGNNVSLGSAAAQSAGIKIFQKSKSTAGIAYIERGSGEPGEEFTFQLSARRIAMP